MEIAASSASYDLHDKLPVYRRHGVREYVVYRVFDGEVDWFTLVGSKYERLGKTSDGIFKSRVFPGLWLDPQALMGDDATRLIEVLEQGLAHESHAAFTQSLADADGKQA